MLRDEDIKKNYFKSLISESVGVGLRQGCVMLPWLVNIYMDGCMREVRLRSKGVQPRAESMKQSMVANLFADDVLLAESEGILQKIVGEFDKVCKMK